MNSRPCLFSAEKIQAVFDADRAIEEIVRQRKLRTPEHHAAAVRFHEAVRAAWPPEIEAALGAPYDDPEKLDVLLRFLEEDPFFFRSGYVKEEALGRIGKFSLDDPSRKRIAQIVLTAVDRPGRREFRRVCTAARHADQNVLLPGLIGRLDSEDPSLVWRAFCAAKGMLSLPHPRGHLKGHAQARRDKNLAEIAALRQRLKAHSSTAHPR